MKKQALNNLITLLLIYVFWIVMFMIQKPVFMLFNPIDNVTFSDFIDVILHGAKLDRCFAAYFVLLPVLLLIVRIFVSYNVKRFLYIYNIIIGVIITVIFSVDCILYSYWGFRMDATLIFYLKDFNESLNSVTLKDIFKFILIAVPYFLIILFTYRFTFIKKLDSIFNYDYILTIPQKTAATLILVVCLPVLVICTRGGISTATANIGMVYYCDNQKLNLAAVNPAFSLVYSLNKTEDFSKKYQFYDDDFCKAEFAKLLPQDVALNTYADTTESSFLTMQRPNIVVIILESFSANVIGAVNGQYAVTDNKEVTPNINKIAGESIVFENAYSNGMRTDRGIVSILTGFLAQPDMTIIKYPEKTRNLPSMAKTLANAGYNTEMIYGGDVNFANMRSFFYSSMYNTVSDYKNFPPHERLSKWGVRDEKTFDYLAGRIRNSDVHKPFFITLLTLSSHEPFDVNMHKFRNPYVNSVAYTDSCLGNFMQKLKDSFWWNNTLIILVADHGYPYPEGMGNTDSNLYRIPVIFTGGVIKEPMRITRFINQTDIPKTLFKAMNLPCDEFIYSRDVFNPSSPDYAFYVYTDGFGFIDTNGTTVWDNTSKHVIYGANPQREMKGKVLLQTLYKDIATK